MSERKRKPGDMTTDASGVWETVGNYKAGVVRIDSGKEVLASDIEVKTIVTHFDPPARPTDAEEGDV